MNVLAITSTKMIKVAYISFLECKIKDNYVTNALFSAYEPSAMTSQEHSTIHIGVSPARTVEDIVKLRN